MWLFLPGRFKRREFLAWPKEHKGGALLVENLGNFSRSGSPPHTLAVIRFRKDFFCVVILYPSGPATVCTENTSVRASIMPAIVQEN
jgi:hypothetical protein